MTATITPVAKHTGATITRPVDGERAGMDSGPAPLATLLQDLANRAQYARGATWGNLIGADVFAVDTGGTSTVFTVRVSAFEAMVAQDTNGVFWPRFSTADTTFSLSDVESAPGNLANSTWYYVYLGVNTDGSLRKQISTTAPIASGKWKSGAVDQLRYVGCFRTNSSGVPLASRTVRGRVAYDFGALGSTDPHRVLNSGADTSFTAVSCATAVPPHARNARLYVQFNAAAAGDTLRLRRTNTSTFYKTLYGQRAGILAFEVETELNSSQQLDYAVSAGDATIYVLGFDE
jgi:hypothetical protein